MAACIGASAAGVRTFTATSSQGLLYAMEMLYTVAGWRAPFVLVNVSRALARWSPAPGREGLAVTGGVVAPRFIVQELHALAGR